MVPALKGHAGAMHRLRNTHARRRMLIAYIAPAFALYTAFMLIPIVNSMRLSFYSGSGLIPTEFVGFGTRSANASGTPSATTSAFLSS